MREIAKILVVVTALLLVAVALCASIAHAGETCGVRTFSTTRHAPQKTAGFEVREQVVVPVVVSDQFFFSVGDYYRDTYLAERVEQKLQREFVTRAELAALIQALKEKGGPGPVPGIEPVPGPAPEPTGVQRIFNDHCISCHGGARPAKGLDLTDADRLSRGRRFEVHAFVNSGEMPRGGDALGDDVVDELYRWAKSAPRE